MRAGVGKREKGGEQEGKVSEGREGMEITHVDRDAGDEHDDCEGVKKLPSSVDAQCG